MTAINKQKPSFLSNIAKFIISRIDLLIFIGVYSFDMLFILIRGKRLLDADMASEMVLSNLLNQEHSISGLTTNWIYGTELRFLQTQWFYRIGLVISPSNWHIARTIAIGLMLLVLAFAVWLMFFACERKDIALYAAAIALCPGGSWYFWQTIFGSYYFPYLCISLLTVALVVLAAKLTCISHSKYLAVLLILIIGFLGVSSGINGVKQLMVFHTPFVLALLAVNIYRIRAKELDVKTGLRSIEMIMLLLALLAFISAVVGYLINSRILSSKYNFMSYDDNTISGNSIFEQLKNYIWSFGYNEEIPLLSLEGIGVMFGVIIGFLTVISGVRLLCRFGTLKLYEQIIVAASCSSIIFCVFIFSYVGGEIQYFQPILPFGLFLVLIDIYTEKYVLNYSRNALLSIFFAMMIVTSYGTAKSEFHDPLHTLRANELIDEELIPFLLDSGYDKGVAFFWEANIITELTNGIIDMWTIEYDDENGAIQPREWLQKSNHIENFPPDHYFYLTNSGSTGGFLDSHQDLKLVYSSKHYDIWGN